MEYEKITFDVDGSVATVTFNRPDAANVRGIDSGADFRRSHSRSGASATQGLSR